MVDWFITRVWVMDFIFEAGREAVCPSPKCTASPDGWLIYYQSLIVGFMFKAGREAVCPRVQLLLMVGWLITKVWLMGFIFEGGSEAVCPRVHPLLTVDWLIDLVWLMDFGFRRGVKRCAHVYSLSFSQDSEYLALSSNTETIHIFKWVPILYSSSRKFLII